MKLERLLELAGVKLDEETLAKYKESKADHKVKSGGKDVKKSKEGKGKSADKGKYKEPKADHKVKSGGKEEKAPEGESKVPSISLYKSNNSTK